jgi:hypothetical protein
MTDADAIVLSELLIYRTLRLRSDNLDQEMPGKDLAVFSKSA